MARDDNLVLKTNLASSVTSADVCALLMGIAGLIIFLLLWHGHDAEVIRITKEDGIVEYLSAFFWLQASIICFYRIAVNHQSNKILLWFWAIFCFLCFGEEISWGQRIFLYSVQAVQHASGQNEFNIHNLMILSTPFGISKYLMHGGKIDWMGLLNAQNLFYIGFGTYFLLIPLLMHFERLSLLKNKLHYHTPSFYYLFSVWPIVVLSFILSLTPDMAKMRAMIETREMFMAFAVLFYVSFYLDGHSENISS